MTASLVQVPTGSCFGVGRRREGYPVCAADAIGERERIGRRIVGAPGHVSVRLEAVEARAIERGVRIVLRRGRLPHRIGHAPAAHELHRARVDGGRARMIGGPFVLLDHRAGDTPAAQVAGERETDRAAADDQDRRFDRHAAWTFVRNLSTSARRLAVCLPI
jgi:hypothetical protein